MDSPQNGHKRRQETRRAEIVTAAAALFFEKGYGRTTMDDVLAAIGGSKRTLYGHFSGKEELFAAIVNDVATRVLSGFDFELAGDLKQTLCELGKRYIDVMLLPDTLSLYRALVSEGPHFPELSKAFFENGPLRVANSLVRFFESHNAAGKIRVREPEIAARQFIGMIRADNQLAAILTGKKCSAQLAKKIVDNAVETLINGAVTKVSTKKT